MPEYHNLRRFYEDMFKDITYFHFNSSITRDMYENRLGSLYGKIINISNLSVKDNRKKKQFGKTLNLAYFGNLSQHKGYFEISKERISNAILNNNMNIDLRDIVL